MVRVWSWLLSSIQYHDLWCCWKHFGSLYCLNLEAQRTCPHTKQSERIHEFLWPTAFTSVSHYTITRSCFLLLFCLLLSPSANITQISQAFQPFTSHPSKTQFVCSIPTNNVWCISVCKVHVVWLHHKERDSIDLQSAVGCTAYL